MAVVFQHFIVNLGNYSVRRINMIRQGKLACAFLITKNNNCHTFVTQYEFTLELPLSFPHILHFTSQEWLGEAILCDYLTTRTLWFEIRDQWTFLFTFLLSHGVWYNYYCVCMQKTPCSPSVLRYYCINYCLIQCNYA